MDQIKINAEARTEQGTGAVRRLRRAGMIPGSVMKMNKAGTELIKLPAHAFMLAMRGRSGKQVLVTLDMGGREVPALLREMQNDVLKGTPVHVDFSEVSLSQKVRITVPLYLVGEAKGVKLGGGVWSRRSARSTSTFSRRTFPRSSTPTFPRSTSTRRCSSATRTSARSTPSSRAASSPRRS